MSAYGTSWLSNFVITQFNSTLKLKSYTESYQSNTADIVLSNTSTNTDYNLSASSDLKIRFKSFHELFNNSYCGFSDYTNAYFEFDMDNLNQISFRVRGLFNDSRSPINRYCHLQVYCDDIIILDEDKETYSNLIIVDFDKYNKCKLSIGK